MKNDKKEDVLLKDNPQKEIKNTAFPQSNLHKININKKTLLLSFGLLLVVLISIVSLLFFYSIKMKDKVLKTVNGENIKKSDLDKRLSEAFTPSDFTKVSEDKEITTNILDDLTREKIIQQEAKKLNITVSDEEITAKLSPETAQNLATRRIIYNQLLEEKVKDKVISWRKVNFLLSYKDQTMVNYVMLVKRAENSLNLVKSKVDNGMEFEKAYEEAQKDSNFDKTIVFEKNVNISSSTIDKQIYTEVSKLKKGSVSQVLNNGAGAFVLIQILEVNDSQYSTFEEWLNEKFKDMDTAK